MIRRRKLSVFKHTRLRDIEASVMQKKTSKHLYLNVVAISFLATGILGAGTAYADCALTDGNAGPEGSIAYFPIDDTYRYCDSADAWITIASSGGASLWTDNTTHITREGAHILDTGATMASSGFDYGNGGISGILLITDQNAAIGGVSDGIDDGYVGNGSFAWGQNVFAAGDYSIALGDSSTANSTGANIAIGQQASSNNSSIAIGADANATGPESYAFGKQVTASGTHAMAFGAGETAGTTPVVSGDNSIGFFIGDQDSVDLSDANTMAIMGASGGIGIGTASPNSTLHILGENGTSGSQNAQNLFIVDGGDGYSSGNGNGGSISLDAGRGYGSGDAGDITVSAGSLSSAASGGTSGSVTISAGITSGPATPTGTTQIYGGGYSSSSTRALMQLSGSGSITTGSVALRSGVTTGVVGSSGSVSIYSADASSSGDGGNVSISAGDGSNTGSGGTVTIAAGSGGATNIDGSDIIIRAGPGGGSGSYGDIILNQFGGRVGIGTSSPAARLHLESGGIRLDDGAGNEAGCIRYDDTDDELEYSDDCTTYVALNAIGGANEINDLSDAITDYTTDYNMFMGDSAGAAITTGGQYNVAIGYTSGDTITTGDYNTAVGSNALGAITTHSNNTVIGSNAMQYSSFGDRTVAIGSNALNGNNANDAVGIGYYAADSSPQNRFVSIGSEAGRYMANSDDNVVIGQASGLGVDGVTTGVNSSVFIGQASGTAITTGDNNTFLGFQAGNSVTSGSDNILIGYDVDASSATASNELNIGNTIYGDLANGYVGIATAVPDQALDVTGNIELSGDIMGTGQLDILSGSGNFDINLNAGTSGGDINFILSQNGGNTNCFIIEDDGGTGFRFDCLNDLIEIQHDVGIGDFSSDVVDSALHIQEGEIRIDGGADNEAGCIRYDDTDDELEFSDDCSTYYNIDNYVTSTDIWRVTGGTGLEVVNNGADAPSTTADFVFGSYQLADTGSASEDSRFFFDKSKKAFRAGSVTGTQWDDGNVGTGSFAAGEQVIASGDISAALGASEASGYASFAVGESIASIDYAIAMGETSEASGYAAIAMGETAISSGTASIAMGSSAEATNVGAVAMGTNTTASGESSVAIGRNSSSGGFYDIAIGQGATANGTSAIAIGSDVSSTSLSSIALGNDVNVIGGGGTFGEYSMGIGLGEATGATPSVTGTGTLAIFSDDQSGVTVSDDNVMVVLGADTGLGTSSPQELVHIGAGSDASSYGEVDLIVTREGSSGIEVRNSSTDSYVATIVSNAAASEIIYNTSTFYLSPNNTQTHAFTNTGLVGINNTSPDVELDVTGDIEYSGTITDVSDRRLKDNIQPLIKAGSLLDRIDQVDTYSFTMKGDETQRTEYGVMAQELESIFPELVHTANDEMGTKSVNYVGLIAPMIEATKELKAENAALKSNISELRHDQEQTHAALKDISRQVALLNKVTGNSVGKASMLPYFMLMIGMFSGIGIMFALQRRKIKA